jgi:PAS domain S-box-containing protein
MSTTGQARAESLLAAEKRMLEAIANRVELPEVLDDLCRAIDAHVDGVISSVALMDPDGKRLWLRAGPRFPAHVREVAFPWPIGAGMGACGTAAFLKQRVIISDVTTDPRWPDNCRDLPVSCGLRAAWSEPLIAKDGAVLGTFAMYYAEPRIPDASDLELIEAAGHIAVIAIQLEQSQAALRESEERFRLVANTAPVLIWTSGPDKMCTYFNQGWLDFTGRSLQAELGDGWVQGVHPEDVAGCLETYTRAFDRREPFRMEYRLRRHDGEHRWIFDQGVPRFHADGSFAGYIGSGIDVTERRLAEEALSTVSQKLIEAHEEERARLARELHDDINQRLALLRVHLERLMHNPPTSAAQLRGKILEASQQTADLVKDIQALTHRLHPSKVELLGLAAAARSLCEEFSDQQDVKIDFHAENVPEALPQEISLCLFRVLQEALQNAIKHSGSRHATVSLRGGVNDIDLTVQDSGVGFDAREAGRGRGLGLTSMKERLKLVDGQLSIHSELRRGTTIHARVPFSPVPTNNSVPLAKIDLADFRR